MRKIFSFLGFLAILVGVGANWTAFPQRVSAVPPVMVTLCHAAGLEGTTQYVTLTIPYNAAFGQAGHFNEDGTPNAGHEDDYLGECTSTSPTPTLTPTLTPTNSSTPTLTPTPTSIDCPPGQEFDGDLQICIDCPGGGTCEVVIGTPSATLTPTAIPTQTPSTSTTTSTQGSSTAPAAATQAVLGATTLAGTGSFMSAVINFGNLIGLLLTGTGALLYIKRRA